MRLTPLILLVALAALFGSGCGGSETTNASTTTASTTTVAESTVEDAYPSLGCDVIPQCLVVNAEELLARCPGDRLDAQGREARRRLEKSVARYERIDDLHSELAYAASDAALDALTNLEEACP